MIKSVSLVTSTRFFNFTFTMQILLFSHILEEEESKEENGKKEKQRKQTTGTKKEDTMKKTGQV